MAKKATGADRLLIAAIERQEALSEDDDIADSRAKAMRQYRGENTNPAEEGRSQYVSRDVYDVVETVKPQLLKLFLSGDEVVRFEPEGPEDVEQAKLETEYINYVALQRNDAFGLFDTWVHDGLVQKNGYVLAYYDDAEETDREVYENLDDESLAFLAQDDEIRIVKHTQTEAGHNVEADRIRTTGGVKYLNLAPESIRVGANHRTVALRDADFVRHAEYKTLSQLRLEGFTVEDDISDGGLDDEDYESRSSDDDDEVDASMRRVLVRRCWVRTALYSGGKKAELRDVIVVGTTLLQNEPCDLLPVVAWSPHPLAHQHTGLSKVDEVEDIANIKTAMNRGMLDNMYLANNGRYAINTDLVNLDDMLISRPGAIVRVNGDPGSSIFPLVHPQTQGVALQAVEYFDQVREARTGMSRYTSGLDPNALNKTATGIMQLQAASMQRVELIGRRLAEAVKELFWITHALTLKHGRKAEMVRLTNKWVPIDPRGWKRRTDLSISVGLGTGNRQEQNGFLMQMLQMALGPGQQMGLTDPGRIYAMLARLTNNAGFKSAEEFWTDPSGQPPKEQPPDPRMVAEQQKAQADQQKAQADMQAEQMKIQAQMQIEREKLASAERMATMKIQAEMRQSEISAQSSDRSSMYGKADASNRAFISKLKTTKVPNAYR